MNREAYNEGCEVELVGAFCSGRDVGVSGTEVEVTRGGYKKTRTGERGIEDSGDDTDYRTSK